VVNTPKSVGKVLYQETTFKPVYDQPGWMIGENGEMFRLSDNDGKRLGMVGIKKS
jgi:hypothetical protein